MGTILFIYRSYIYEPNVANISPITVPVIKIKVIFLLIEFGKNVKNSDPPPQVKVS